MTAPTTTDEPVLAHGPWRNNAELILDVHRLGYITDDHRILDCTYGLGRFWNHWRPTYLTATDIDPTKSPIGRPVDFTDLPFPTGHFDVTVLDGPYKLNGTSTGRGSSASDADYGVATPASWQDRHALLADGLAEAIRVTALDGRVLFKCQDQVCSGAVRWQTDIFTAIAADLGARKIDRFDLTSYRAQPAGRRQVHARRNTSALLVFEVIDKGPDDQLELFLTPSELGDLYAVDTADISTITPGAAT